MMRYTTLRKYKRHLLRELGPVDDELKACALRDSKEHLDLLIMDIMNGEGKISRRSAFHQAVEAFGDPSEIAQAYRKIL